MVSSAGIEPAATWFVVRSLENHQDEERRRWVVGGRKRTRTPHPFRGAHCFRNRSGSIAGFSSVVGGQCGNRTRYAELFRLPLYRLSLPTKITCRGRQRTRTSHAIGVRLAFQAISVASRICLPEEFPEAARHLARSASRRRRARGRVARPRGEAHRGAMRGRKPHKIEGHFCVMAQDAGVVAPSLGQAESGDAQYGCQSSGRSPSPRRTGGVTGRDLGLNGLRSSFMPASSGVRHPFLSLHA